MLKKLVELVRNAITADVLKEVPDLDWSRINIVRMPVSMSLSKGFIFEIKGNDGEKDYQIIVKEIE
jgi:hypothetical protein